MGWVMMSERELNRVEVLAQVDDGRLSVDNAANMLDLTRRQVFRLLKRYRQDGAAAIRHKSRGKPPNNLIHKAKREYALSLIKESYPDFGPTLAAEMLVQHHGFKVSRETLRKWMVEDGIWLSRKQRRTFHQPRLRRECFGELIQIDGSDHRWFEDRAGPCTLLVFIDDATSTLMELRFVKSESTFSYFEALESYLIEHGRPVAFYSDKHTVFRVAKQDAKGGARMTQFGRALNALNVEILCANSSQAKGRVERANRTLQDRLVKELRLANICDMEAGNAYLQGFKERHNAKFAKAPVKPDNLHRALNVEPDRLADVLCWRENRYVGKQLTFSYDRKRIMLEESDVTRGLVGKYVDTYAFVDGRFEVRSKGRSLPYKIFDMDQRVTHAAVTENKRLGAVLEHIKEMQDAAPPKPKVRTNSEKMGYRPNGKGDLPARAPRRRLCMRQNNRKNDGMDANDDPEIIFSDYTQSVVIDGHHFDVEIYRTSIDPGWILSVENQFRTLTVSDNPPFFGDLLAWRAFEELVRDEGIKAFYNNKERHKLGL